MQDEMNEKQNNWREDDEMNQRRGAVERKKQSLICSEDQWSRI